MFKVFVSHSSADKLLIDALRELICDSFVEEVALIYSSASVASGGITAGQSWLEWIHMQIEQSSMAIVVLTPLSKLRPWLMWEAGAVTGLGLAQKNSTPIVPLLFGIKNEEVPSPLRERQTKSGTKEVDIRDLLESFRLVGNLTYKTKNNLDQLIDKYIQTVNAARIPGMYDLFISCPMSSIKGEKIDQMHLIVDSILAAVEENGYSAYSALRRVGNPENFDPEAIAAETDFVALKSSRNFLMIYPSKTLSSCLLEAGYALVEGIPSTYFVQNDDDLPYMLRGALESFRNTRRFRFREQSQIVDLFLKYKNQIIT